jgi:hypothetical protein
MFNALIEFHRKNTSNCKNSSFARNFVRSSERAAHPGGSDWAVDTLTRSYPGYKKFESTKFVSFHVQISAVSK